MSIKALFGALILSTLFAGCVSQTSYDKLNAKYSALERDNASKGRAIDEATRTADELDRSLAETRQALKELADRKAEMELQLEQFKSLTSELQTMIDTGSVKVTIRNGRMIVSMGSDVLFKTGSARLSPTGAAAVAEVSRALALIPNKDFQVEGHTDNLPIKNRSFPSNWQLAAARAFSVLTTMQEAGMPSERVSMASYADTQPAVPNDTLDNRALNRRIDIVVVPDLSKLMDVETVARTSSVRPPASVAPLSVTQPGPGESPAGE
jgi:chemotaxis protein MotB